MIDRIEFKLSKYFFYYYQISHYSFNTGFA